MEFYKGKETKVSYLNKTKGLQLERTRQELGNKGVNDGKTVVRGEVVPI